MEDVGPQIGKLRIGHDGSGHGAGWHLYNVLVRRVNEDNTVSSSMPETCVHVIELFARPSPCKVLIRRVSED